MTNSVSMEDAMQAIRDALGYRDSLKPKRELIPNLPRDDGFFVKRLAAIGEKKAHDPHTERPCQSIPLIIDRIKKMWSAGHVRIAVIGHVEPPHGCPPTTCRTLREFPIRHGQGE